MAKARKHIPITVFVIAILVIIASLEGYFFSGYVEDKYEQEVMDRLNVITEASGTQMTNSIDQVFQRLESCAILIEDELSDQNIEESLKILSGIDFENRQIGIGVGDSQGKIHLSNGESFDYRYHESYMYGIVGKYCVVCGNVGEYGRSLLFSVPVMKGNGEDEKFLGMVYGVCDLEYFQTVFEATEYSKDSILVVSSHSGDVIGASDSYREESQSESVFDYIYSLDDESETRVDAMKSAMKSGKNGIIQLKDDSHYVCYRRLVDENWYLIMIVDEAVIMGSGSRIVSSVQVMTGSFIILFLITFLVVKRMQDSNQKKLERIAYYDELTGGISFEKFRKEVYELAGATLTNKNNEKKYAVVSIDVDKFKVINDIFGYEEGNRVIRYIWSCINEMIEPKETFAHRKADQFVMFVDATDQKRLVNRMEDLAKRASEIKEEGDKNYEVILSIGIYIVEHMEEEAFNINTAIDRAELTKKSIKGKRNNRSAIYDDRMRQKMIRDQDIENKMERAIETREFKVYYQPKYNALSGALSGAEALVRWYNDKTGMIFPNEFIPLFESNGFIVELDKYMFESVCMDIRTWLDQGYEVVPVSVNLSQLQLYNVRFIDEYIAILKKHNVPPKYVQLELTETTLFSEASLLNQIIDRLHAAGFSILMDDFGTGYSSLNMLKNVPVDILKLDKSFVDDIGEDKGDIVVSTIVSLGQSLDMKIVAEGVESKEQFRFLRNILCDEIQGYYFSRPISANEYAQLMHKTGEEEKYAKQVVEIQNEEEEAKREKEAKAEKKANKINHSQIG